MPTFNQLVRQGRNARVYKSKSPVLQKGYNSLEGKTTDQSSPQKRGVCTKVSTTTPKKYCSHCSERQLSDGCYHSWGRTLLRKTH